MTEELPAPKSRKEEYLAKAAGMEVEELPTPASREEIYLDAIAQGGGGGGGTSDFDELTNRPKYNGTAMTSETDIPVAPTVVQTTGTSETDVMSQDAVSGLLFTNKVDKQKVAIGGDITLQNVGNSSYLAVGEKTKVNGANGTALGAYAESSGASVAIGSASFGGTPTKANGPESIAIGCNAQVANAGPYSISIGNQSYTSGQSSVSLGYGAETPNNNSVSIGRAAKTTRNGEVNIGSINTSFGYNSTKYRVLGGVHDGIDNHDAATVGQVLGETESYTIATSDWSALSASSPYTYQATVTATHTIGASTIAELINDAPVTFATYGFAIGDISGQSVTIYSIGQPSDSVTLKVNYKG